MKQLLIFIILYSIYSTAAAEWEPCKIPGGGTIECISALDNYIFAGTELSGIFISTNKGETWNTASNGLKYSHIRCFAVSGNYIFTGTRYEGVFLSTNKGENWKAVSTGLKNMHIYSLAILGNTIFAGTEYTGIFSSSNNGEGWSSAGLNGTYTVALAISGNSLFASANGGPYLSTDNGLNWSVISNGLPTPYITCFGVLGTVIFAGTELKGISLSTNNGAVWEVVNTGLPDPYLTVYCFTVAGKNIFAGTDKGLFLSRNNGGEWINIGSESWDENTRIYSLLTHNNYIYAGSDSIIWKRSLHEVVNVNAVSSKVPSGFELYQNYPNPFNPGTTISYELPRAASIKVTVYDIHGKEVSILIDRKEAVGKHSVEFKAQDTGSGIYFYTLSVEGKIAGTKKMILLK